MARRILTAALALVAVAMTALVAWLALHPVRPAANEPTLSKSGEYSPGALPNADDTAVLAAVARGARDALSFDYRHLDANLETATSAMTASFAEQFRDTFTKTASALAPRQHAITKALVRGAALVARNSDSATCLVFVDQLRAGSGAGHPDVVATRLHVTLQKAGDRWLISDITPF